MSLTMRDRGALAAAALGLLALSMGGWLLLSPTVGADPLAAEPFDGQASFIEAPTLPAATPPDELVVDVQGGVARPGLVVLAAGARVADAVAAAGGYAPSADLLAAATAINLAAPVSDGQQVFVPLAGVAGVPGPGGGDDNGGLVNLNTASPEALEALPGIGPVTVQKIVAARAERPFASLDELVERKVLNRGQLDDIRELATL
ncbi:MAG TPA: helix-hairpin-helix domain-containing protein [Candidatus Dormibacteraeota bacterium]|nr:helix-hairpin-helix domain-containing protein [Candidatus Dormibacteraeota bacterium]